MRFLTAGESHGPALTSIIEGLPAGLSINENYINAQLTRRQGGYGRGARMSIEKDKVKFISGVRFGKTTGSPLAMIIENQDWPNWEKVMSTLPEDKSFDRALTTPRPGHADLAGGVKYLQRDLRNILERASARETAMRVAVGAIASLFLEHFTIKATSFVTAIGKVEAPPVSPEWDVEHIIKERGSTLFCLDREAEDLMVEEIDRARKDGDSLGGIFEIHVNGLPFGLGSHVHWDRRLDGLLAGALMSIPGIKGVEIGLGFDAASRTGSETHDEFFLDKRGKIGRGTNTAGGIEGGITNGETVILRAAMKPIPTLLKPLSSIDLITHSITPAPVERSDICAVPAASVVGEAVIAWEIAQAFLEKFAGDSIEEIGEVYQNNLRKIKEFLGE